MGENTLIEFTQTARAIGRQQEGWTANDHPYRIEGVTQSLNFKVSNISRTGRQPGLQYDPFHIGQAMAVRDALNDAYQNGYNRAIHVAISAVQPSKEGNA